MEAASSARPLPYFDYMPTTGCEPPYRHDPIVSHRHSDELPGLQQVLTAEQGSSVIVLTMVFDGQEGPYNNPLVFDIKAASAIVRRILINTGKQVREMLTPFESGWSTEEEVTAKNERRCEEERHRRVETQVREALRMAPCRRTPPTVSLSAPCADARKCPRTEEGQEATAASALIP
ncbi:hypothetical protein Cgig2_023340 [Carnegiea gigantea]|uniref:Uncharacterized protein n=1 Tax=Carnegiea gigantea TaxID=171969 RepID=A0A9Q1QC66_9CARY|nr:hypothetical protein Cgig2_023340 [Carnegiea gigantea]